jgi:phage anti-repressor protein
MNQLKTIANDMLPVYENETGEKLVNARELHEKLFISTRFNDWITRQISNYGFMEGEDFYSVLSKTTGRPSKEFFLVIDTAKEIAMVQNNEQGRVIRKYFIQVEKQSRVKQPQSQAEMMLMFAEQFVNQEKEIKHIKQENETLKHRMDNYDNLDTVGDLQQRLNAMVRKYAAQNGIAFPEAWRHFTRGFNNAYRTNLKSLIKNYKEKHGLKSLTAPQYLSMSGRLEDAVRVADKMLNQQAILTNRELV